MCAYRTAESRRKPQVATAPYGMQPEQAYSFERAKMIHARTVNKRGRNGLNQNSIMNKNSHFVNKRLAASAFQTCDNISLSKEQKKLTSHHV